MEFLRPDTTKSPFFAKKIGPISPNHPLFLAYPYSPGNNLDDYRSLARNWSTPAAVAERHSWPTQASRRSGSPGLHERSLQNAAAKSPSAAPSLRAAGSRRRSTACRGGRIFVGRGFRRHGRAPRSRSLRVAVLVDAGTVRAGIRGGGGGGGPRSGDATHGIPRHGGRLIDLPGQGGVILGAVRLGGIVENRLPEARRLGEADVAPNPGFEQTARRP